MSVNNKVTVTAKIGPAQQDTAVPHLNIDTLTFDFNKMTFAIEDANGIHHYDLTGVATVTDTVVANVHTIVIS